MVSFRFDVLSFYECVKGVNKNNIAQYKLQYIWFKSRNDFR